MNSQQMEEVYSYFHQLLVHSKTPQDIQLQQEILQQFPHEVLQKMKRFSDYKKQKHEVVTSSITSPKILLGDNRKTLLKIKDQNIHLIFTSPPYYNAKNYSFYTSYLDYLQQMKQTFIQCHRILEEGRFMIINISPVIGKRPSRPYESIRYPIPFDFHRLLTEVGFTYQDEIIWIKPESTVPNRMGGFFQHHTPLTYKPNCITESLLVYRKNADFLLDQIIRRYPKSTEELLHYKSTNCWYISPKKSKEHPAVFPEELCERVLQYYSFSGDVVCDPFAGSGTVGTVARRLGRIPILCEQKEQYINTLIQKNEYQIEVLK